MDSLFHKEVSVLICILFDAYFCMCASFDTKKGLIVISDLVRIR